MSYGAVALIDLHDPQVLPMSSIYQLFSDGDGDSNCRTAR
jgi:hypothetical protein